MTLEEAIRHAEEKAKCGGKCGEDHAQLAMWLMELKQLRTSTDLSDFCDRLYERGYERGKADAQPDRKPGRWLRIKGEQEYVCQECGQRCLETIMLLPKWDYCPSCGAYMGGDTDGDMPN